MRQLLNATKNDCINITIVFKKIQFKDYEALKHSVLGIHNK